MTHRGKRPYSPAVVHGEMVFVSGQVPIDRKTGKVLYGGIEEETRITLENLRAILEEKGSSLKNVVKVTVFLANIDDYEQMNKVYMEYFKENRPARTCVGVKALPFGVKVEMDAIAYCK
jgi:2-iminobutanoate/2-iminopropanoate deaminase